MVLDLVLDNDSLMTHMRHRVKHLSSSLETTKRLDLDPFLELTKDGGLDGRLEAVLDPTLETDLDTDTDGQAELAAARRLSFCTCHASSSL